MALVDQVRELRDAAVALRREWEEPSRDARWEDVAVWFGSLAMLGPARLRGFGAFASVTLISRTWAAAHRRHTRHVNDVVGRAVELVAEDLEDRASTDDFVQRLAESMERRVSEVERQTGVQMKGGVRDLTGPTLADYLQDFVARLTRHLEWHVSNDVPVSFEATYDDLVRTKDDIREYLDGVIVHWRRERDQATSSAENIEGTGGDPAAALEQLARRDMAVHYIDAFQSVRSSLLDELLPETDGRYSSRADTAPAEPEAQPLYPYPDGDTLVIGPEAFVAEPGHSVISWRGENYYRADTPEPPAVDRALADAQPNVILPLDQALALRAAVLGDAFSNVAINDAVTHINLCEDADRERREPIPPGVGAASVEQARAELCDACNREWTIVGSVDSAEEAVLPWGGPVEIVACHAGTPSKIADSIEGVRAAVAGAINDSGNGTAALRTYVPGADLLRPFSPQSDEELGPLAGERDTFDR